MADAPLLKIEVVAPDKSPLESEGTAVVIPGRAGDFGVLPGHTELLSLLRVGEMMIESPGATIHYAVNGGYAEVRDDKVLVLTQTIEQAEEIDVERAERAKERAETRLAEPSQEGINVWRAELALQRALIRLQVASKHRGMY